MSWSNTLDALIQYIGIPAFALSAGLATREIIKSKIKLSIADAEYFQYSLSGGRMNTDDVMIGLRLTVNNRSSRSIVVNRVALIGDGQERFACSVDSSMLFGISSPDKAGFQVRSNPLPVNIAPYQGCRILLSFRHSPEMIQKLSLPDPVSLSAALKGNEVLGKDKQASRMRIELYTDRRPIRCTVSVSRISVDKIQNQAQMLSQIK